MIYVGEYPEKWEKVVAIDLETTGLDPFENYMLSVAVKSGEDTYVYYNGVHDFAPLVVMLEDNNITKVAHNALFDMKFLKTVLNATVEKVYCTMLAEQVIDAGRGSPVSLADVLARRLGIFVDKGVRESFIDRVSFAIGPPTPEELDYIVGDVEYLIPIRDLQIKDLIITSQVNAAKHEMRTLPATVALELGGIVLDIDMWYKFVDLFNEKIQESERTMREIVGDYVLTVPAKLKGEDILKAYVAYQTEEDERCKIEAINFGSPKQLLALLKNGFGLDITSTGAEYLEEIIENVDPTSATYEFLNALLENRKWLKRLGFDYVKYINPVTGRVHPEYRQLGARTGRFSCANPNMQQVPRPEKGEPNMRHLWRSDGSEYVIIRADYAQQEPRILGQLTMDERLIKACNSEDVYLELAKLLYNDPTLTKASHERQIAKMFFLAVGYGSGPETLARQSGLALDICTKHKNEMLSAFPGLKTYVNQQWQNVQTKGFVTTLAGSRRYIDDKDGRAFTTAVNTPVQGTAAYMFKVAMYSIHEHLTELIKCGSIDANTRLWNVVHDEVEVHCHIKDLDTVSAVVKSCMENAGKQLCPDVSHIAELEYGETWDK